MKTECPQKALDTDCSTNTGESTSAPSVVIATGQIGATSEVWLWREIIGFDRIIPKVLTWAYNNEKEYPLDGTPVRLMTTDPSRQNGRSRWLFRLRNLSGCNFYGAVGKERRELRNWFRQQNPTAILCHYGQLALRILPVAEDVGIPLVAHFHGIDLSASLNNRWYRWSLIRALPRFGAMVVVGSHQRKWLIEHGADPQKVHLIPCGVPTEEFTPPSTRSWKPFRFICVSRLMEFKGVSQAITAFEMVHKEVPDSELIVIGDGPDRSSLHVQVQELGLERAVHFLGAQPPGEVRKWLRQCNVFLQHSLDGMHGEREGFGVTIAEASSCTLPVVVTRCGGIPDQVVDGKTGFIIPQRDVQAMANAMMQLARDPELRRRMGESGRSRMVQHFDTGNQIAKLEDVLLGAMRV